jgi:hypothetical protein
MIPVPFILKPLQLLRCLREELLPEQYRKALCGILNALTNKMYSTESATGL